MLVCVPVFHVIVLHLMVQVKFSNYYNIFKVPEVPKKPVPEKVPVPVPKKVEAPPVKGTSA